MGGKLTVIWPKEKTCNINYREVFDDKQFADIQVKVIQINPKKRLLSYLSKLQFGKAVLEIKDRLKLKIVKKIILEKYSCIDYHPPKKIGWIGEKYINYTEECWKRCKYGLETTKDELYIHAYNGILQGEERKKVDLNTIKFNKKFLEETDIILAGYEELVGVHIRRTDHIIATKNSSLVSFINNMQKILTENPQTYFFLSTDDLNVEKEIKQIFKEKVITQKSKYWGRDTKKGMESAIIDGLCLSRCQYILGSYTSVFSEFFSQYGKKELIICKDKSND